MPVRFNTGGGVAAGKDTATEKDVRYPKTFHSGQGVKAKVGQILDCAVKRIIPSTKKQTIPAGSYIAEEITVDGDEALVSKNIRAGTSIFGVDGKWSVVDTATANLDPEKMLGRVHGILRREGSKWEHEDLNGFFLFPCRRFRF